MRLGSTRQTCDTRWAALENRCVFSMREGPLRNLVLAREPHTLVVLRVGEEAVEHPNAIGMAVDAVMETDEHHPAPCRTLLVKLVEFVFQGLLVGHRVVTLEGKRRDVIHVKCVRHGYEVFAVDRNDERLVVAGLINVVKEPKLLTAFPALFIL